MAGSAQGIVKTVAIMKQSAQGVLAAGAGSQALRRVTFVPQAQRDTFDNNEIRTDQQSSGVTYGLKKTSAKLSGLLSPATYKLLFAQALRKDFVTGVNTGAIITVAAATTTGAQGTFTRSAGSFLTDGFKLFDIVQWTGWATTGVPNNNVNMLVIALTATVMTVTRFDTTAIGAKVAGDSVTCTVRGKKTLAPLTGHTNDFFTIEDWYNDITRGELYGDVKANKIDVGMPATGNATFSADLVGLSRTLGAAQVLTSPTAVTTTPVVNSSNGVIWANGSVLAQVTGVQFSIDGGIAIGSAVIGSNNPTDLARGRIKASGQFQALFVDASIQLLYDGQTPISLFTCLMDSLTNVNSSFIAFKFGRIKITGDVPDDGEKVITRTYTFTAEIDVNGGAALANDQTIMSIQDSDA